MASGVTKRWWNSTRKSLVSWSNSTRMIPGMFLISALTASGQPIHRKPPFSSIPSTCKIISAKKSSAMGSGSWRVVLYLIMTYFAGLGA